MLTAIALVLPARAPATFAGGNGLIVLAEEQRDEGDCGDAGHHICEDFTSRLMAVMPRGGGLSQFVDCLSPCTDTSPAWSPDGRRLAFARSPSDRLFVVSAHRGRPRQLPGVIGREPAWSPDGRQLVYSGRDGALYRVSVARPRPVRLTPGTASSADRTDRAPTWCSDGTIAFNRQVGDHNGLYVIRRGRRGATRLAADAGPPDCSPGSRKVLYSSGRGTFAQRLDGRGRRRLLATSSFWPRWSPDGRSIVYSDGHDAFVVSLRGPHVWRLTGGDHRGNYLMPAWRPVGR